MGEPVQSPRLRERSTGDLLVLLIAGTVCFVVLGLAASLIIAELFHENKDTSGASSAVSDVINTLIGLLAGFLAGRSETALTVKKAEGRQEEPSP